MDEELLQQIELARARARARMAARDATATRGRAPVTATPPRPASGPGMVDSAARFIARHEGFRPQAYRDRVGRGQPWTVGYGRTGKDVTPRTTMTEPEALQWVVDRVRADSTRMAQAGIQPNPGLLSLVYNAGMGALGDTDLGRAARAGDWDAAASAMQDWVHGRRNGRKVVLPGLVRRRAEEARMLPGQNIMALLRGEDQ